MPTNEFAVQHPQDNKSKRFIAKGQSGAEGIELSFEANESRAERSQRIEAANRQHAFTLAVGAGASEEVAEALAAHTVFAEVAASEDGQILRLGHGWYAAAVSEYSDRRAFIGDKALHDEAYEYRQIIAEVKSAVASRRKAGEFPGTEHVNVAFFASEIKHDVITIRLSGFTRDQYQSEGKVRPEYHALANAAFEAVRAYATSSSETTSLHSSSHSSVPVWVKYRPSKG